MTNGNDDITKLEDLLKRTKALMPKVTQAVSTMPALPTTTQYFTAEEASQWGVELETGWRLKYVPPVNGGEPKFSYITPEDWEITQDEEYISPQGQKFNRREYEAFVAPSGLLYEEYKRTGGELSFEDWAMLGAPIRPFTEQALERVFPEGDIEDLLASMITEGMPEPERLAAEKAQEEFIQAILEIGRTKDTEALLRQMGADSEYIDEFFAPPDMMRIVFGAHVPTIEDRINMMWIAGEQEDEIRKVIEASGIDLSSGYQEEGWWKDNVFDPFLLGASRIIHGADTTINVVLPFVELSNRLRMDKTFWEKQDAYIKEKYKPSDLEYVAYFKNKADYMAWSEATVKSQRDQLLITYAKSKIAWEDFVVKHPEIQPKPEYLESPWEHPELLKDPSFWVYTISENLAYSLSILATITLTGLATGGNVPIMVAVGTVAAGAPEGGDIYEELLAHGCPEETAAELALLGALVIGAIETMSDIFLLGVVSKPVRGFLAPLRKKLGLEIAKAGLKAAIKKGITTFLTVEGIELFEEIVQGAVHNALLKSYDEDRAILENIPDTIIRTLIATLPFALFGGGAEFRNFRKALPSEMQTELDTQIKKFVDAGATEAQAQIKAVNELAKVEANREILSKAIDDNRQKPPMLEGVISETRVPEVAPAIEKFLATPDERIVRPSSEVIDALKARGFSDAYIRTEMSITEMKQALARPIPEAVPEVKEAEAPTIEVPTVEVAKPPVEVTEREYALGEVGEMEAELAGLKEWLTTEPAAKLVSLIKRTGWRKGEISNLTIAQYKKITGKETVPASILTTDKKHVKWEYALDGIATELGYRSGEELREGIERAGESLARIKALEAEIPVARAEVEFPVEVTPEEEIQKKLTAVQKIRRFYQEKIKSYDQTKKALVDYVNKNLPLAVRGKMLAAVKNVKTELGLTRAINRVNILAERNAQKELQAEIRKEIKKSRAVIRNKILKGKFTPDTQRRLDILSHNLELDRDQAREKIANNINQYDEGKLSYEEMLEANEALNFAGIKGMSSEELAETLGYIRSLKEIGKSERQAKAERATERIRATREDIIGILTDGKGLKPGIGTVSPRELQVTKGWLEKLVNWQYSWDNFMDKLSKFDKTSKPYQSKLSVFGKAVHYSRSQENVGSRSATGEVRENFSRIFETTKSSEINQILNRFQEDKINLGTFKNLDGVEVTLNLTKDQIINKYQQLQDLTLEGTFTDGMRWTDEIKQAIENNLSEQERAWADWQMEFYQEYYEGVNKVYTEIYGVDLPHNLNYSPIKRDLEAEVRENVLTFQDAGRYASVLNGSLYARRSNKIPLRFNGSTGILINHITQMEHFKAWATTMRDMRRVFGNKEVRTAIRQYHGAPILRTVDGYLNDMARGGIERALINRGADFLRRNFARSILSIKPVIGLKQIPSVLAYTTEMPIGDFVTGVADFWSHPLKNYSFLIEHSSYARERFGMGFERDIKFAMRRTPVGRISGKTSVVNWFMLQIRLGDKLAATQGMWAKYKSVMKGKAETAENIDMAMREAQISTDRTQPSFDLETLSPLQKGGSWVKLLTMFQNQPNKYFRIMADNARNFQYGRGNRAKAASNILLVWVILPCLFQFIADAFQFKPERQARAVILGPLNWLLIFGPLAQSAYGWVTDEPFDYQASPVMQTGRDIQTAIQKTMKLIKQGKDQYQNISVDDAIAAAEYFAKAVGELLGYPTPWLVQAERGVRAAITEDEPERYLELIFSRWSLEPPRKGANERVNELLDALGLPVEERVEKPLTGEPREIYDMANLNSDIKAILGNTLPSEITAKRGFSPLAVAWAEKEQVRSVADTLPNIPLYKINTDTEQDDTILQYYKQWKARERIDNLADLREFDKLYPKAELGNVTRQQYSLLTKYLETPDDKKKQFVEDHPELKINPRNEWLKSHPKENAQLAVWGQAKIYTLEAYNEFKKLVKDLDIPDDAIPEFTLPPEGSVENYFKYLEQGEELGYNSWEIQLLIAQDDELRTFLDRQPIETPVRALELKIKHRELFDEYDGYSDRGSPLYIEDDDARDEARDKLRGDNPEWVDDMRRIEAIENDATDDVVESWVERGRVTDEFSAGSSEAKVWLLDNPKVHKWALEQELLTDDGSNWNEPILRINAKWRVQDDEYDALPVEGDDRKNYLAENEDYRKDRRRRDAYRDDFPEDQIENYVAYYELPSKGYRQERMLIEDEDFGRAMHEITGIDLPERVPAVGWDETYEAWQVDFDKLWGMSDHESEHYIEDVDERAFAREVMRQDIHGNPTEFGKAEKKLDAYALFVPEAYVPVFVEWYTSAELKRPAFWNDNWGWYEDDWFLMEHPKFYQTMLDLKIWLEPRDFSKVPSRKWHDAYVNVYVKLEAGRERYGFRGSEPWFDEEGVRIGRWKPYDPSRYGSGFMEQLEAQGLLEEWRKIFR